jgi:hypothetical protein
MVYSRLTHTREHTMASAAQVEANRRNAQKSTGPRTEAGKARTRLNALKSGAYARAVTPVLPHEDPRKLAARVEQWCQDLKPQNAVERELVARAARLSWVLERAERYEAAHLARRVRKAQLKLSARRMQRVCDLGRKLLYDAGPRILPTSGPPWDDNPAAFLCGLEESVAGCRWLLERWRELRNLTHRAANWTRADMFKFVRLQGKFPVEAINDATLNAIFLAWDTISPGTAQTFWSACKECKPLFDPGFSDFMRWREIADRPADAAHAILFLTTFMDEQIERIEEMLAVHVEIAGDEAAVLADLASFEPSACFERLRRFQSSKTRELKQTLDALHLLRNGKAKKDDSERPTTNGRCRVANKENAIAGGHGHPAEEGTETPGPVEPASGAGAWPIQARAGAGTRSGHRSRAACLPGDSWDRVLTRRLIALTLDDLGGISTSRSLGANRVVPGKPDCEKAACQITSDSMNASNEANPKSTQAYTDQSVNDHSVDSLGLQRSQSHNTSNLVQCPRGELTEEQST